MDQRLVAWARAVKSRHRTVPGGRLPPLWLFTDAARMPDLVPVIGRLPRALCGVVFRHDGAPGRAALGLRVRLACRARRITLVSAAAPVPGAGRHLRGGRLPGRGRPLGPLTASAHGPAQLVRGRRVGARAIFLSPAFATVSHRGAVPLGPVRWAALARGRGPVLALGGITGRTVRRLPRWCRGVGAIGALAD